jgi:tetratricopeptide (TPR) repeat protein
MASRHVIVAQLLERVRKVQKTKNGLALAFWGEPGIGKTHAATQLIHGLPGNSLKIQARATIRDFLVALPVTTRSLPTWASRALEMAQQDQVIESRNLIAALEAKLAVLAPFTLHLENWHEANSEQHEFWTQLVLFLRRTREVLVLVTSRTQPPPPFEGYQLERLSELESDMLFETEISGNLPTQAKTWVFQKAQGNPLFTLEFFRYLSRQGNLWNDGSQWRWRKPTESAVPHSVEAVLEQVLEAAYQLPNAKIALGALALIEPKDITLLASICKMPLDTLSLVCTNLERLGVLRGLEFSHPLYRELVLRDMPQTTRRDLAHIALNMPALNPAQLEAYLDMALLEPATAMVLPILERGWLAAEQSGANLTAARLKARASRLLEGKSRRSLALEAVRVFVKNDTLTAIEFLEWLMGVFPDDSEIVEPLATIYAGRTQSDKGLRLLEGLSEREHSPQRWRRRLFEFLLNANQYEQAFIMFDSDAHLLENASVTTLAHTAFAFIYQGRFEEANSLLQQIRLKDLQLAEKYTVLTTQGTYAFLRGDLMGAFKIYSDALVVAEALSTENKIITALHNRSVIASALYRFHDAANDLERSLKRLENIGDVWISARHLALLGSNLVESGDFVRAEDLLLESRAIFERGQPSIDWMMLECTLAELYYVWDTPHADVLAMKHARGALFYANNLGRPSMQIRPLTTASQVEGLFGSPYRALEYAIQAIDMVEKYDQQFARGYALETYAMALSVNGRFDEAKETLEQASVLFRDSGALLKAETVLIELDRLNHDTASAQRKLELFKQAGYGSGIAQIKRAFPNLEPAIPNLDAQLNLRLLGPLTIELNGNPLRLQGAKRKAFIALLAEANALGREGKQKLQLLDALYPTQSETDALTALHQLVYSCRASLGENNIMTLDEGYGLRGANLDITQFLETGDTSLWRGPYLADVAVDADSTLLEALTEKLHQLSEELLASDAIEAVRVAKILLEMNTYDLRALKVVVKGLQSTKQYTALTRFYSKVRTEFLEVGEGLPERWADFLEQQEPETRAYQLK